MNTHLDILHYIMLLVIMAVVYILIAISNHNTNCVEDIYRRLEIEAPVWRLHGDKESWGQIHTSPKSRKKGKSYKK